MEAGLLETRWPMYCIMKSASHATREKRALNKAIRRKGYGSGKKRVYRGRGVEKPKPGRERGPNVLSTKG